MKAKPACILFFLLMTIGSLQSQNPIPMANLIKYNLTPTAFGIYTIQYERVINLKQSAGISFSIAPNVELPFKSTLIDQFGDNEEAVTAINSTTFTNFSITPEYRFYVGSVGAPVGFYLSSFIRYSHMSHTGIYQFTTSAGVVHNPEITTTFNGIGIGEMIGIQWLFGAKQNIVLDWWIVGPYFGYLSGTSHGTDDMSDMTEQDKIDLENDIEAVEIPLWTIEATVGDGVVDADLKGGYYGVRLMGLCIGVKF
jgi:hypothetical protein